MIPISRVELRVYEDSVGARPFAEWADGLDKVTGTKVTRALTRLSLGNGSNVKSVGSSVQELKIDYGPGYRVYFGRDGAEIVILLGGGTKARQDRDIANAIARWKDYKARKRPGG